MHVLLSVLLSQAEGTQDQLFDEFQESSEDDDEPRQPAKVAGHDTASGAGGRLMLVILQQMCQQNHLQYLSQFCLNVTPASSNG